MLAERDRWIDSNPKTRSRKLPKLPPAASRATWIRAVGRTLTIEAHLVGGRGPCGCEVLLYRPILWMRSSVRRRAQCPMDGLPFFPFVRIVLPEERPQGCLAGTPGRLALLAQKPLAIRSPIVQNGPAWSCVTPPRYRVRLGKYWPVKSASGKLPPKADRETGSPNTGGHLREWPYFNGHRRAQREPPQCGRCWSEISAAYSARRYTIGTMPSVRSDPLETCRSACRAR